MVTKTKQDIAKLNKVLFADGQINIVDRNEEFLAFVEKMKQGNTLKSAHMALKNQMKTAGIDQLPDDIKEKAHDAIMRGSNETALYGVLKFLSMVRWP